MLAERIHSSYGAEFLEFDYVAIPRGGLIVLGMLSHFLNLPRERLTGRSENNTLVIVDDCCYSGSRVHEALGQHRDQSRIIVAVLYATDQVLQEIRTQEDSVIACIHARTLTDLKSIYEPDEDRVKAWRSRSIQRFPDHRYWVGLPELVVFPWTEPATPVWNREKQSLEPGWKTRPPDKCLANWAGLGLPPRLCRSTYRVPDKVVYRIVGDSVQLFNRDCDDMYLLEGSASLMWRALVAYGDESAVLEYLTRHYVAETDELQRDLEGFISSLLSAGLLEKTEQHET